jgi:hypothetical protein
MWKESLEHALQKADDTPLNLEQNVHAVIRVVNNQANPS